MKLKNLLPAEKVNCKASIVKCIPKAQTSVLWEKILSEMHSKASHLIGILPPSDLYSPASA